MPVPTSEVLMALELSSPALRPSARTIRRSEEGQIAVVTRLEVHIITPACGMKYDLGNSQYATPLALGELRDESALKIFRTVADIGSFRHHAWATDLGGVATNALGSLSITCKGIAWSPTNLSSTGACLLAILTTNLEVFIYDSPKNHLSGEWRMIIPLTEALMAYKDNPHLADGRGTASARTVLQAQITCIDWSPQVSSPLLSSDKDLSFLALGNRASQIILWRYRANGRSSLEAATKISEEWITDICWTPWVQTSDNQVMSTVACALADGAIKLVNVKQSLDTVAPNPVEMTQSDGWVHPPDSRTVTGLAWILQYGGSPVLVYTKPGMIHLWSPAEYGRAWSGTRSFRLNKLAVSLGSSSLHPPSGFNYISSEDALLVTLSDGSFTLVYDMSTEPTFEAREPDFTPLSVTRKARAVFVEIEDAENIAAAVMQTYGGEFIGYGHVMWLYRKVFPTYLNYLPDMTQVCCLALVQLWRSKEGHSEFLADVSRIVLNPIPVCRRSLSLILLAAHLYLNDHKDDSTLQDGLTKVLTPGTFEASDAERRRAGQSFSARPLSRTAIQESVTLDILDGPIINSLRLRIAFAKLAENFGFELEDQIGLCRRFIRANVLCGLMYCIADDPYHFKEHDLQSAQRIVQVCRSFAFPTSQAKAIWKRVSSPLSIPSTVDSSGNSETAGYAVSVDLHESCPVCQTSILMDDLETARCGNGHVWERCSVTTTIMPTPHVRTCVVCARKAHLPPSQLPETAMKKSHSWLLDIFLESARCCLYCGGRFVRL